MFTTSVIRHRATLVLSGVVLARTIWDGRHSSIVTCYSTRKPYDSSITTSRLWRLAIRVYWYSPVVEVLIQKLVGLLAKDGQQSPTYLNGKNQN